MKAEKGRIMKRFAARALALAVLALAAVGRGQADPAPAAPAPEAATAPAATAPPQISCEQVIHDVDLRRAEPERLLVVLRVTFEPGSKLAYLQTTVLAQQATDDKGNSWLATGLPTDVREDISGGAGSNLVRVYLKVPPAGANPGRKLPVLSGDIRAAEILEKSKVAITGAGGESRDYNGVKAVYKTSMTNATTCKVEFSFDLPANLPDEDKRLWNTQFSGSVVHVSDDAGATWRQSGGSTSGGNTTHYSLSESFSAPAGAAAGAVPTVTFEVVTGVKPIRIPFRVENVPLP
jgi:hypothetical protein